MRKFLSYILTFFLFFVSSAVLAQTVPTVNNVRLVESSSGISPAPLVFPNGTPVRIHADVSSLNKIKYVRALIKNNSNNNIVAIVPFYDDGASAHGDDASFINGSLGADDGVYSALWLIPYSFQEGIAYSLLIEATDNLGNIYSSDPSAPELIFFTSKDQVICTVGEIVCGGNLIQQCALNTSGLRYWQTNTDCGLNVCCGSGTTAVCCNNGEVCSSSGTCLLCNNLCDGNCQDTSCANDPDCSGVSCCGNGTCDSKECLDCPLDCSVADCCGNGTCDLVIGENMTNCSDDCICHDADGDGHAEQACGGDDCDDNNKNRFPGNLEICDGIDNDCNPATTDENICDVDNDNFCDCSQGFAIASNLSSICPGTNTSSNFWWNQTCDCVDNNFNINPGVAENCSNGIDDNCNGDIDNSDLDCQPNIAPSNPVLTINPPMINSGEETTISFSATGNITYYRYYYCEGVGCEVTSNTADINTTENPYISTGSVEGPSVWNYSFRACNSYGCSNMSTTETLVVNGTGAPTDITFTTSPNPAFVNENILFQWSAQTNPEYYEIQQRPEGGDWSNWIYLGDNTVVSKNVSYSLAGVYWIRVRACNSFGCTVGPIVIETVNNIDNNVPPVNPTLSLSPITAITGQMITYTMGATGEVAYYELYSCKGSAICIPNNLSDSYNTNDNPYNLQLPAGPIDTYRLEIRACNSYGCSGFSNIETLIVNSPGGIPSNPILTINPPMINSGEETTISFSATGNITYYRYYYCEGVGCEVTSNTADINTTENPYISTGSVEGPSVWNYSFRACNSYGCSNMSTTETLVVNGTGAPTDITFTTSPNPAFVNENILFQWSAQNSPEYYEMQTRLETEDWSSWFYLGDNTVTFSNITYPTEGVYWIRVRACNSFGCTIGPTVVETIYRHCLDNDLDTFDDCYVGYFGDDGKTIDCDDNNANKFPGNPEICNNGIDDDCDGNIDNKDSECAPPVNPTLSVLPATAIPDQMITYTMGATGGIEYYEIYSCVGDSTCTPDNLIGSYNTANSPYSLQLPAGPVDTYRFNIRACNISGCSDFSSIETLIVIKEENNPPSNAQLLISPTVANANSIISYTFSADGNVDEYRLYYCLGNLCSPNMLLGSYNVNIINLTLTDPGIYRYQMEACNSYGCSDRSNIVDVTINAICNDNDGDTFDDCYLGDFGDDGKKVDCDDNNANINPDAIEICDNGIDDNCDGNSDCADSDCASNIVCLFCSDGTAYNSCSTVTGTPWYCDNSGNLIENCGSCGCSGSQICGPSNTFCCDNQCNGSCSPSGCTVAYDPDCACQDNNSCCGVGCDNTNDNDCPLVDNIVPVVSSFTAVNNSNLVDTSWTVSDAGGSHLDRIEIWRASDNNGSPVFWSEVVGLRQTITTQNVDTNSGAVTDDPGDGTWWYGLHAVDQAGNVGTETSPLQVIVNSVCAPDGCNGNCPVNCTVSDDPDCGTTGCCGDGTCGVGECSNCSADCQVSDCCGNGTCDSIIGETNLNCSADCTPICTPDGCNGNCPSNCDVTQDPDCGCRSGDSCCGVGCDFTNDSDCPTTCGNAICESGEDCVNCPEDCGACPVTCPDGICDGSCDECEACPADCTISDCCGNGSCNVAVGETNVNCPADCAPTTLDWSHKELPTAFPSDSNDWMTPVKNQGTCGSCWAFGTIGAIEGVYNIEQNNPDLDIDLAEEYVVSTCFSNGDCNGGSVFPLYSFIETDGIVPESCFPYTATNSDCSSRCANWASELWKIGNFTSGDYSSDINSIKTILFKNGPVTSIMSINVDGCAFDGDIYKCSSVNTVNHSIVIVGYSDIENCWIVKNSWGAAWNDNGYFKVGYNANTSIENYIRYPVGVQAP